MGPTWGRQDPGGSHVGLMNLAITAHYHNPLISKIWIFQIDKDTSNDVKVLSIHKSSFGVHIEPDSVMQARLQHEAIVSNMRSRHDTAIDNMEQKLFDLEEANFEKVGFDAPKTIWKCPTIITCIIVTIYGDCISLLLLISEFSALKLSRNGKTCKYTMEYLWNGQECLTKVAKFSPFACTILHKSCLFCPSWHATSFWKAIILSGLHRGVPLYLFFVQKA